MFQLLCDVTIYSSLAKKDGFSVCQYCTGHGIGSELHAVPEIRHEGDFLVAT